MISNRHSELNDAQSVGSRINQVSIFCSLTFWRRWDGGMRHAKPWLTPHVFAHWRKRHRLNRFESFSRSFHELSLASPPLVAHVTVAPAMEIIVLGAGAIGSLYGAKLAAANDVTLVGRPAHVQAVAENGLRIEGIEAQTVRIRAITQIEQLKPDTLILLTTKVPATTSALECVAPLAHDDTTIVALQNGLDSDQVA